MFAKMGLFLYMCDIIKVKSKQRRQKRNAKRRDTVGKAKLSGITCLLAASAIWGGMFVAVKGVVGIIPPMELVWLRYLIATICLLAYAWYHHVKWHWNTKQLLLCVLVGLFGYNISLVTQETGTMLSNAQMGAVVTTSMPLFTVALAWIFLREKIRWQQMLAVLMATAGVLIIVGNNMAQHQSLNGIIMLLISSLAWAIASLIFEKMSGFYSNLQVTIICCFLTFLALTPWTAEHWSVFHGVNFLSPKIFLSLLFIGAITTALACLLWNKGILIMGADTAGIFYLTQPIVGTLLGWLCLGEQVSMAFGIGTVVIISSILMYLKK